MTNSIVEISGLDYTGKSTQAEMLTHETWHLHVHNFGSFSGYGNQLPQGLHAQEYFQWWFQQSTFEDLSGALIDAYTDRHTQAEETDNLDIAVVERGKSMLKAQIVANFATRSETSVEEWYDKVDETVDGSTAVSADIPRTEILLTPDSAWNQSNARYLPYVRTLASGGGAFTASQNEFYATYLANTRDALMHYGKAEGAHTVTVNAPAVDIHNSIRQHEALSELGLPPLLPQNPLVLGLAGLSESGKGTIAQSLADQHGYTRLKLGYFNETLRPADRSYADPSAIAMHVVRFLATNRHINRMTLESLHGPQLGASMKLLLGDRWKSTFIKLNDTVRAERLQGQYPEKDIQALLEEQKRKDARKLATGVAEYLDIADIVIDNSGPLQDSVNKIIGEMRP